MNRQTPVEATANKQASELALLPIGSFEQHGDHLPFGTDNYEVEAIAAAVARATGAFLLPVQPVSVCYEHHGRRGSMHYSAAVFFRFLVAAGEALHSQGFCKIVYLCGHGGVFVLEPAVEHLNAHHPGLQAIYVPAFGNLWNDDTRLTDRHGIHAGEMETALMLHLHPELVDMAKAVDFLPEQPQHFLNYGSIFRLTPDGVWGNATGSTPETGRWVFERSVNDCIEQISRAFSASAKTHHFHAPGGGAAMNRYGADWTLGMLNNDQTDMAYLPLAAFGVSEPHLPPEADLLIGAAFARAISDRIGAFLLPVQPFATRYGQSGRQHLGINADLMYDMVLDLAQEIRRQGFRRLVIQETCSGKTILYSLQRHLNAQAIIKTVLVNPKILAGRDAPDHDGIRLSLDEIDCTLLHDMANNTDCPQNSRQPGALFAAGFGAAVKEIEAAYAFMEEIGSYA